MQPDKCSGPDGYSPGFYQHFWNLCSDDIFKECCAWLDTGQFPPDLNITNIALILKGSSHVSMKDWHPIALCNVLYKIISKVLANRLKDVLPHCISDNQSAFVPGRSILDNARVEFVRRQANGVAHSLAREAMLLASLVTYYDIPNCIETLIINEML